MTSQVVQVRGLQLAGLGVNGLKIELIFHMKGCATRLVLKQS